MEGNGVWWPGYIALSAAEVKYSSTNVILSKQKMNIFLLNLAKCASLLLEFNAEVSSTYKITLYLEDLRNKSQLRDLYSKEHGQEIIKAQHSELWPWIKTEDSRWHQESPWILPRWVSGSNNSYCRTEYRNSLFPLPPCRCSLWKNRKVSLLPIITLAKSCCRVASNVREKALKRALGKKLSCQAQWESQSP